jgi:hypothetical protein
MGPLSWDLICKAVQAQDEEAQIVEVLALRKLFCLGNALSEAFSWNILADRLQKTYSHPSERHSRFYSLANSCILNGG